MFCELKILPVSRAVTTHVFRFSISVGSVPNESRRFLPERMENVLCEELGL